MRQPNTHTSGQFQVLNKKDGEHMHDIQDFFFSMESNSDLTTTARPSRFEEI
jgi:hypothetical protein